MLKFYPLILMLGLFISCGDEKLVVPITVDKQVDLLIDLYSAEALIDKMPLEERDSLKQVFRSQIAEINGLKESEMDLYLEMMQKDRLYYFTLQKRVTDSLKVIQNELSVKKTLPRKEIQLDASKGNN